MGVATHHIQSGLPGRELFRPPDSAERKNASYHITQPRAKDSRPHTVPLSSGMKTAKSPVQAEGHHIALDGRGPRLTDVCSSGAALKHIQHDSEQLKRGQGTGFYKESLEFSPGER